MNQKSQQVQCPNCKSYKLLLQDNVLILIGFAMCFVAFFFFFLFFPLGILMGIAGMTVVIVGSLKATFWKSHRYSCQNCHYKFQKKPETTEPER